MQLQPGEERQGAIEKISALSARDFERSFIEQNLMDRENDLKIFKHYACAEKDQDIRALAEKGQKMLTKHLKMVKELDSKNHASR